MSLYEDILKKILDEVDGDIRDILLKKEKSKHDSYHGYDLLNDPMLTIIEWQRLRNDSKKQKRKSK